MQKSRGMIGGLLLAASMAVPALGQVGAVDKDYIKTLASPGKTVLVIEYYDGQGKVAERKGYASASGYKPDSPTSFVVNDKTKLSLYGLEPCEGEFVNRSENFAGSCPEFAKEQLATMLQSPKVLFCRAFISELTAPNQNATCFGYYNYPGAMDSVDNLESQLLSLGAVRLKKKPDGSFERPDLEADEKIGQAGKFGMWADERSGSK